MRYPTIAAVTVAFSLAMTAGSPAADQTNQATPYDGLKKTVSVDRFLATEALGGLVTADGMTALLTDALVKDGRFVVVERPGLSSVMAEQVLGQVGGTDAENSAKTSQLIGASSIVRGAVTKFEPAASGGGLNLGGLPMGSFFGARAGLTSQTAVMEISLRLIDTTTGQVISTSTAQGTANSTTADATLVHSKSGAAMGGGAFQTTPIGQAGEQAIILAVEQIATGMRGVPWSALVVDSDGGTVYVNAGSERNVQAGMALNVYRKGKVFTDPATGVVLDVVMQKIGAIRIDGVREKLSTAVVVSGETPVRGNLLRLD